MVALANFVIGSILGPNGSEEKIGKGFLGYKGGTRFKTFIKLTVKIITKLQWSCLLRIGNRDMPLLTAKCKASSVYFPSFSPQQLAFYPVPISLAI